MSRLTVPLYFVVGIEETDTGSDAVFVSTPMTESPELKNEHHEACDKTHYMSQSDHPKPVSNTCPLAAKIGSILYGKIGAIKKAAAPYAKKRPDDEVIAEALETITPEAAAIIRKRLGLS
jgi:hypothetical protein